MIAGPIRERITEDGQPYQDDPVYAHPKEEYTRRIAVSVADAFGSKLPQRLVIGHDRVLLQWMKPDGKGGLMPR